MDYKIVYSLSNSQIDDLMELFSNEWWSETRQREEVSLMLKKTDICIGFIDIQTEELFAFARILTDFVYKAYIHDVIVAKNYREKGYGEKMIQTILNHPLLKKVQHLELYCLSELVPFYKRYGFQERTSALLRLNK